MRRTILIGIFACAGLSGVAWAKGGAAAPAVVANGGRAPTLGGTGVTTTAGGSSNGTTSAGTSSFSPPTAPTGTMASSSNGVPLPGPPPSSLTPSTTSVPASTPPQPLAEQNQVTNGQSAQLNNLNRPSSALNAQQLSSVQASLAAGGLYSGPIDGINSAATRAAIAQYQQVQGIPASGNLDAETLARLDRGGVTGSNGTTSTSGNASSATGLGFVTGSTAGSTTTAGTGYAGGNGVTTGVISSTPAGFGLSSSAAVNMSPFPPAGSTMQP